MRDVVVLGGGAAGLLAALALRGNAFRVQVQVRPTPKRPTFLMTTSVTFEGGLQALGLADAWHRFPGRQPVRRHQSRWGDGGANASALVPPSHVLVDRDELEDWLIGQAKTEDVNVISARTLPDQLPASTFHVDATGRASALARSRGATRRRHPALIATFERSLSDGLRPGETRVYAYPYGWTYCANNGSLSTGIRFGAPQRPESLAGPARWSSNGRPHTLLASSSWLEMPCGHNWAAVGDAALACDPLAAAGLEFAATSALLLRNTLQPSEFDAAQYAAGIRTIIATYRIGRQRAYRRGSGAESSAFWRQQDVL